MSSTNKTLTIELSQYVGTDKPTYLSDYNGDMLKIDNAIAADRDSIATAQSKADGADAKADTNAGAISDLDSQVNNASNGLTKRVTDVEGDVNTIESLIGNGTPTTTDKTIIGAINELNAEMPSGTAAGTSYNNSTSGLSATNVQDAIDELSVKGYTLLAEVTSDGTKTISQLLTELWAAVSSDISKVHYGAKLLIDNDIHTVTEVTSTVIIATLCHIGGSTTPYGYIDDVRVSSTPLHRGMEIYASGSIVVTDKSSIVLTSGRKFKLYI